MSLYAVYGLLQDMHFILDHPRHSCGIVPWLLLAGAYTANISYALILVTWLSFSPLYLPRSYIKQGFPPSIMIRALIQVKGFETNPIQNQELCGTRV